jgi:hypothetical protein
MYQNTENCIFILSKIRGYRLFKSRFLYDHPTPSVICRRAVLGIFSSPARFARKGYAPCVGAGVVATHFGSLWVARRRQRYLKILSYQKRGVRHVSHDNALIEHLVSKNPASLEHCTPITQLAPLPKTTKRVISLSR